MALYFSENYLRELLDRNDIESIISSYVTLKRSGTALKGLCPFHKEKTPSFSVSPDKQLYHCFGCGKSGTAINFIMDIENLDFVEAVTLLAEKCGMALPDETAGDRGLSDTREEIYKINSIAGRFYYDCLNSPLGAGAVEYIIRRGLTNATVARFGIGYAPSGDEVISLLSDRGYTEEQIIRSGIVGTDDNGRIYPRFRNRLMFPIIDRRKNIIGFGGRVLDDSKPKYLNSPETAAFNKSYNLYGLNLAKNSKTDYLILVEGYMDVISLHQYGVSSAVATLGTALTSEQARIIKRMKNEIIIAYDSDEAGQKATRRAIEILADEDINVRVMTIPGSKDPDEFIKANGSGAFNELILKSQVQIEYKIAKLREQYNLHDTADKIAYVNSVAAELVKIKSAVEREIYIKKISEETGVSENSISSEISKIISVVNNKKKFENFKTTPSVSVVSKSRELSRFEEAQKIILNIMCYKPDISVQLADELSEEDFSDELRKQLFTLVKKQLASGDVPDARMIVTRFINNTEAAEILHDDHNIIDYELAAAQCLDIIKKYVKKQRMLETLKGGSGEALQYKGEQDGQ